MLNIEQLTREHPAREMWKTKWTDYRLIYEGGEQFIRASGLIGSSRNSGGGSGTSGTTGAPSGQWPFAGSRNRRFLYQLEGEPDAVYYAIWNRAYYLNYAGAILDYNRMWLFSQEPQIRPSEGGEPPDWWADFYNDATGSGTSFPDFVRDCFLDPMVCRIGGWLIGCDSAVAEAEDGVVVLTQYPAENIFDWSRDSKGELEWIVIGRKESRRDFPADRYEVETYTYLDRQRWETYEIVRGGGPGTSDSLTLLAEGEHGLDEVPFVMVDLPPGLWVMDKLAAPCVDIFNKQVRLTNAQLLGCILQPYVQSNDPNGASKIFGEGIILHLSAGDATGGGKEDMGWKSPDTAPLQFIADQLKEQRDEIYRIMHQMALAVDSKAVGAIARSGASKIEDRKATEVILAAFGKYAADAMLRTVKLVSKVYGDDTDWSIDGFKNFQVSSLDEELQIATLAASMNFKSSLAKRLLELKVIGRLLDGTDEKTMQAIAEETKDAYDQDAEGQMAPQSNPATGLPLDPKTLGVKPPVMPPIKGDTPEPALEGQETE